MFNALGISSWPEALVAVMGLATFTYTLNQLILAWTGNKLSPIQTEQKEQRNSLNTVKTDIAELKKSIANMKIEEKLAVLLEKSNSTSRQVQQLLRIRLGEVGPPAGDD